MAKSTPQAQAKAYIKKNKQLIKILTGWEKTFSNPNLTKEELDKALKFYLEGLGEWQSEFRYLIKSYKAKS